MQIRVLSALLAAVVVSGCAGFSRDGGFDEVSEAARSIGKDVQFDRGVAADRELMGKHTAELLAKPLEVEDAVQLALLNNRALQASFQELGIAESALVRAGRLPNPHISVTRRSGQGHVELEQSVTLNVLSLLTIPLASRVEERRFARARSQVTLEVLRLAAETRKAYFVAVAAEESVRYMRQVRKAAEAGAELARRMAQVGNFSALTQARERSFFADAALQVAAAELSGSSAREQLTRLLGLWGEQVDFKLPERLPDLPKEAEDLPGVESLAMERRIDLRMARLDAQTQARDLGLTKATRFINVLEAGPTRARDGSDEPWSRGYEISFELPLFDFGSARVARAEAIYMQTVHRTAEAAINARSEVREAYRAYRGRYDIARHYRDEIVPLRKKISEENMLRYNGMLIGVFELLADARTQIASVNGAIEAQRDFWIAKADLDMALVGKPTLARAAATSGAPAGEAAGTH